MKLTESELDAEWDVEYETTLGMMCGASVPSEEQKDMAKKRADEHIAALRDSE